MAIRSESELRQTAAREVNVWLVSLPLVDKDLLSSYETRLLPAEKARLHRFAVDSAREQFLVARALVRHALSHHVPVSPEEWIFGATPHGKPHIVAPDFCRDLQFNLSHTDGLVACAVSRDYEVGIDVENTRREIEYLELAEQFFAPAEIEMLKRLPYGEQQKQFFSVWTLKEAYLKAEGTGLSLPLNNFWFEFDKSTPRIHFSLPDTGMFKQCQFKQLFPTPSHQLAIAIKASSEEQIAVQLNWAIPEVT